MLKKLTMLSGLLVFLLTSFSSFSIGPGAGQIQMQNNMQQMQKNKEQIRKRQDQNYQQQPQYQYNGNQYNTQKRY